jgi:hypothetical protein
MLLVLILLVSSVRFQPVETEPEEAPLPVGVQAAESEPAEPSTVEPAAVPALATPDPAVRAEVPSVAGLHDSRHEAETRTRVLVLTDETVQELRLPARLTIRATRTSCTEPTVEHLARS